MSKINKVPIDNPISNHPMFSNGDKSVEHEFGFSSKILEQANYSPFSQKGNNQSTENKMFKPVDNKNYLPGYSPNQNSIPQNVNPAKYVPVPGFTSQSGYYQQANNGHIPQQKISDSVANNFGLPPKNFEQSNNNSQNLNTVPYTFRNDFIPNNLTIKQNYANNNGYRNNNFQPSQPMQQAQSVQPNNQPLNNIQNQSYLSNIPQNGFQNGSQNGLLNGSNAQPLGQNLTPLDTSGLIPNNINPYNPSFINNNDYNCNPQRNIEDCDEYGRLREKYRRLRRRNDRDRDERRRLRSLVQSQSVILGENDKINCLKSHTNKYREYLNFLSSRDRRPFISSRDKEEQKLAKFLKKRLKDHKTEIDDDYLRKIEEALRSLDYDYPKEYADWIYRHDGDIPDIDSDDPSERRLAKWLIQARKEASQGRLSKESIEEITKLLGVCWLQANV